MATQNEREPRVTTNNEYPHIDAESWDKNTVAEDPAVEPGFHEVKLDESRELSAVVEPTEMNVAEALVAASESKTLGEQLGIDPSLQAGFDPAAAELAAAEAEKLAELHADVRVGDQVLIIDAASSFAGEVGTIEKTLPRVTGPTTYIVNFAAEFDKPTAIIVHRDDFQIIKDTRNGPFVREFFEDQRIETYIFRAATPNQTIVAHTGEVLDSVTRKQIGEMIPQDYVEAEKSVGHTTLAFLSPDEAVELQLRRTAAAAVVEGPDSPVGRANEGILKLYLTELASIIGNGNRERGFREEGEFIHTQVVATTEDSRIPDNVREAWAGNETNYFTKRLMLLTSEIVEAFEELRSGHGLAESYYRDEEGEAVHLSIEEAFSEDGDPLKPEGFPSEMADIFIRFMDLVDEIKKAYPAFDIWGTVFQKLAYNATRPFKHGRRF